jgi:hypothetical protein
VAETPGLTGTTRLLTEDEVIVMLGLTKRPNPKGTLRWQMRMRRLPYVKVTNEIRCFRLEDVEAFIESRRVPAMDTGGRIIRQGTGM